jgi:hexosaminidase
MIMVFFRSFADPVRAVVRVMGPLVLLWGSSAMAADEGVVSLIPRPVRLHRGEGAFTVTRETKILIEPGSAALQPVGRGLADKLAAATGYDVRVEPFEGEKTSGGTILLTTAGADQTLGPEGYQLTVAPDHVLVRAAKPAGVFYGVQTLYQLLPAEIESPQRSDSVAWTIPAVEIEDRPRFAWRGMHLDVARHFFPKEFVKRYIDFLASQKINTFHLYLTDDQGWRIEIKRYPRLTEVGAWRKGTVMHRRDGPADDRRYGGYYTQDDVREIVRYAGERFITVVPGISMPGHSQAALAAYPELSSTGGPFEVWTNWGISKEVMDPGKEEVFEFVQGVLDEVIELFPGPYVHTGGDEVPRDRWQASPFAQARMKREGLSDENGLQSYFTKRVEAFLNSKGKRLIGWDEILEGGLAPNATVMSWRGTAGGIEAARSGHQVVMTPNRQTYFNYAQDASGTGPGHTKGLLTLSTVYHFDPAEGLAPDEARYVLGGQGCLWTEYVPTPADVEYLLFPRLFAMAEALWSPKDRPADEEFFKRVVAGLERLDTAGVKHYPSQHVLIEK